ncbi:MAG: DNA mismatch repair protein MutS [Ktedonobacterales bacterium]|jgi:DNA mismatch repair protein MutS|nr:MAG: DNA mismatch repair protein MutS [Ktedonobacterales bacterium]
MTTPARRQYLDIKAQHLDAILLYQIGDFFETFDEDARIMARELQIVLTGRSFGPDEHVPLAGVPVHALEVYAGRLVARGYKVAICEQITPPGRGLVHREVTRILTPGTVIDPGIVPVARDNYLVAIVSRPTGNSGLAYVDASTGAFACTEWHGDAARSAMQAEIGRLSPPEILVGVGFSSWPRGDAHSGSDTVEHLADALVTECPEHYFDPENARSRLCRQFGVTTLAAFGCADKTLATSAAGAILAYVERMNPALVRLLTGLRYYCTEDFVEIDGRTLRALELLEPTTAIGAQAGIGKKGSTLLATLDATQTAMGARLLRRILLQPLRDRIALEERLDAIEELHDKPVLREGIGSALDGLSDIERLSARITHGVAVPRELLGLADCLRRVPRLRTVLRKVETSSWKTLHATLDDCAEVCELIARAVVDPREKTGRTIRPGYDEDLDRMIASVTDARQWIVSLEAKERERTGIKSLKVGFNKVFGYYIEVSRPNLSRVPGDYQRRQTLTSGERFITPDLKEHEALVLHAEDQIEHAERALYTNLLKALSSYQERLRRTAAGMAQADVWLSLANVALIRDYVRPELTDATNLEIVGGRHPVVEAAMDGTEFIANDTRMAPLNASNYEARIVLLTGPNMAGKSTYLRQVALIVLMAQIGSFVPAKYARIGLVDRIFARVGAQDDLARGLSTFMLEMVETAYILRFATPKSLIILDEVGRGTSTHDGMAIAHAVLEYLHDVNHARTLFATHYYELAALGEQLERLSVFRMAVMEVDGEVVFLHKVVPGVADTSYGVQVARMAGLPEPVIRRARTLLANEAPTMMKVAERRENYTPMQVSREIANDTDVQELTQAVVALNIAAMTPIEAINMLFSLQQLALTLLRMKG